MQDTHQTPFALLDAVLVNSPFGNSEYVTEQMHACYTRRLAKLAGFLPSASRLIDSLERATADTRYVVFGDMVFRCAVQHAIRQDQVVGGQGLSLQDCSDIFEELSRQVAEGIGAVRTGLRDRLGPTIRHGAIWGDESCLGAVGRAFGQLVQQHYDQAPCAATSEEIVILKTGVELLERLLPLAARSALSHTHVVALFSSDGPWETRCSSSEYWLSGTIFLNRHIASSAWSVAEHVFHESLHQQLYDLRQAHSILKEGFDRDDAPTITSLWNSPGATKNNFWDVHRSVAAFHVYVHLALLSTLADASLDTLQHDYGKRRMTTTATAIVRARYLEEQLRGPLWDELGVAGRKLVEWFGSVLDALNQSPPPSGSRIHLLLDRYRREATEVELYSRRTFKSERYAAVLDEILGREVASMRAILAAADRTDALGGFEASLRETLDSSVSNHSNAERSGRQFALTRRLISRSILSLSPDGYTLPGSSLAAELVERMVHQSSDAVHSLVERYSLAP